MPVDDPSSPSTLDSSPSLPQGPIRWQTTRIVSKSPLSSRVTSFVFELESPFAFVAGQHVDVRLTAPDGYRAERSYSIASAPENEDVSDGSRGSDVAHDSMFLTVAHAGGNALGGAGTRPSRLIELAIERLDDGEVSTFFHDVAEVGDEIELRGPIGGHFVWNPTDRGPILLVGGGSGVVPLVSMLRRRANLGVPTMGADMVFLVSARTWDDVLFRDEILAWSPERQGIRASITLTREGSSGASDTHQAPRFSRRIDSAMIAEVIREAGAPPETVYVCGANAFVDTAADAAIAAGITGARIRTERYGG